MKEVVIIGGGIIGQFSAYYLQKAGHKVTVVDKPTTMSPASAGNCGLITPSHVAPLNSWSAVWQGIKWLGKADAPLSIKPQLSGDFIKWFTSFLWHCRKHSRQQATDIRHGILQRSWELYNELFNETDLEVNWRPDGILYVYKDSAKEAELQKEIDLLNRYGLSNRMLTRDEVFALEPSLKDDVAGGALYECDGWLSPHSLLAQLKALNARNGITQLTDEVLALRPNHTKMLSAELANQSLEADEFVVCGGAQSALLTKKIGIPLDLIPGKGYHLQINTPITNQPSRPIYMFERKVVATPWDDGFRLGSTMEFTGFDLSLNTTRLDALKRAAKEYLQTSIDGVEFIPWAGWRPMTSTSLPIIKTSHYQNLTIATGHGMLGLSMAPATAETVCNLINYEN